MKKLLVIVFTVLIALPAFAQFNFGLKVGATTTTVPTYNITTGANNIEAVKNAGWGFQGGVFLRLGLKSVYIQPEIVFATNSYEYDVTTVSGTDILKQNFNRLEIPLLLGIKLGPLHINAGPSATVQIGSPKALIDDPNFVEMYRGATYGFSAGLGLDIFKKIIIDARYNGSLSGKFGDKVTIDGQDFKIDSRQPSFTLSVGLMF
ncbi:MAG: PorT family protein [Bacteroidales bacterium]|nr:PorT family protein [Bacteroidales bacterium]